ncbi:hypothetical protein VTL71DRAFT_14370 [Oculimacula yallundae]|uniref:Peptidase C45 hydrolase domain-containing protein n=1 Tax=Oculimacula yallundae TaxID=86028 RepID=A0ABR4CKD5_9HELO
MEHTNATTPATKQEFLPLTASPVPAHEQPPHPEVKRSSENIDSTKPASQQSIPPEIEQDVESTASSTTLASEQPIFPAHKLFPGDTDITTTTAEQAFLSNVERNPEDSSSTVPTSVQTFPSEVERVSEDVNLTTPASEPISHPKVQLPPENTDSIVRASEQTILPNVERATEDTESTTPSSEQTSPPKDERTPEDIQDEVLFLAASIFRSWDQLHIILDAHQDTIFARWTKKTRALKEELLVEAWPEIPRTHRPDFAMFEDFKLLNEVVTDPQKLAASKWPHMNLEDLCKGKHLLMLIETRARYHPIVFARSDLEASLASRAMSMFSVANCSGHSIYATVIPLVGNEYAQNRLKYGADYGVSEGLLILEIQQKLLQFLQTCCEGILHDKKIPSPLESWTSLHESNKTAPYRPPVAPDFQQLISLLVAHLTMTTGYFLDTVTAYLDSTSPSIADLNGQADPIYEMQEYWDACACIVIDYAYSAVIMAETFFALATNTHARFGNLLNDGQLPSESPDHRGLLEQMLCLRYMLDVELDLASERLSRCISSESSFGEYFTKKCSGANLDWVRPESEIKDRLFFLFSPLGYLPQEIESQMGKKNLLNEIENILESAPGEKGRLSPNSLKVLGRVGCFLNAIEVIDSVLPSTPAIYAEMTDKNFETGDDGFDIQKSVSQYVTRNAQLKGDLGAMSRVMFGTRKSSKFDYPCWKTRTPETIDQMHLAEKFLDECWRKFENVFYKSCGRSLHDNDPEIFKYRKRTRTEEPKPKHVYKDSGVEVDEIDTALALLDLQAGKDGSTAKVDLKTSDLKTSDSMTMQELLAVTPSDFTFTERSMKVFRKMFSTPSPNPPGDIKWKDFLQAMLDAGFQITKQYGSLWLFTPQSLGADRSIFLHEPPLGVDAKSGVLHMDFKTAQRLAKRLSYAYGWDETWFLKMPSQDQKFETPEIVELSGLKHGRLLSLKIRRQIKVYTAMFQQTSSLDWQSVRSIAQDYSATIQRLTPDLHVEMAAIAEGAGAGIDLLDIVALNCRSEIALGLFSDGCTSLGWKLKTEGGNVLLAQNWDWTKEVKENLVMMSIEQTGKPKIWMVTEAGIVGKIGFNSSSVGTNLNAIRARPTDSKKLPIHIALRLCLESESAAAAIAKLESLGGIASSAHILLADPTGPISLELSPRGDVHIRPNSKGIVCHTNHFIQNRHVEEPPWLSGSPIRLARVQALTDELADFGADVDGDILRKFVFSDKFNAPQAICCQEDPERPVETRSSTLFNIVMSFVEGEVPSAEVVWGRPGSGEEGRILSMPW